MIVRSSPILLTALTVAAIGLAGCGKTPDPADEATRAIVTSPPDPAAPAPGTQAAEAIGADSSSVLPVVPPEKQQR